MAARNCAGVIWKLATREPPLVATSPPGWAFGCDRKMALTSTSTFGTVYDARLRKVVRNGSLALHSGVPLITSSGPPNRPVSTSHVSLTPRPVLVPPCSTRPLAKRMLYDRSTPCQ